MIISILVTFPYLYFFFFNDTATTEIYTLSLHDALPISAIAARFPQASLLVLGDLMIDQYLWGNVSRISPEAPVPVVRLERESFRLGGAGNVVNNLLSLGARPILAGVRGDDRQGELLEKFCRDSGLTTEALIVAPG